jgi:hypothetical protein
MEELKTANSGKWGELLFEFKSIERADKKSYTELIDKAKNTAALTPPQRSAIIARCNNVLNGTYNFGDMAKSEAYDAKANKK